MIEIKRKFDKEHPLKIALEYYLDKEISYDNFASIMPKVEHQMNFNWNLVNAGIAGLGYVGIQKRKEKYWSLSSIEKERNKLRKSLAINMGLDVCYMLAGAILKNRAGKMSSENQARNIGFGNSLILQGGFLFVFDGVFVIKIKK